MQELFVAERQDIFTRGLFTISSFNFFEELASKIYKQVEKKEKKITAVQLHFCLSVFNTLYDRVYQSNYLF